MKKRKPGGWKIRSLNTCMILLSCLIFGCLIASTVSITVKYRSLLTDTRNNISCQKTADDLTKGSDLLTEQVRMYAENRDLKYMDAYFEEAKITRRRDRALERLQKLDATSEERNDLQSALDLSNQLMQTEMYSMKLISTADGCDASLLPEDINSISLSPEDAALSPEEMIAKGKQLVFSDEYQEMKNTIYDHLTRFLESVTGKTYDQQLESEASLAHSIITQRIVISLLFLLNLITFVAITVLVVRPLSIHIRSIQENSTLDLIGSYEFRYLAETYNTIYRQNKMNQKALAYKAEHDALTGILNRSNFESLQSILKDSSVPLALAVIDVDEFKEVNDTYGHAAGDDILKRVADLLIHNFRSDDYVIRLGGDEFVVILTDMTPLQKSTLESKFERINSMLLHPESELPRVSLSVGVAFSESGFEEDLFERADAALYEAKNGGRSQCRFFG